MTERRAPKPFVVAVAGGSGSGKTTVARALGAALPAGASVTLEQDHYYRDRSELPLEQRVTVNYDHPDAIEFELLLRHVDDLVAHRGIDRPSYDFSVHARRTERIRLEPAPIVIVEGILALALPEMRERYDLKVFVDTDADIRLMRRIRRDLEERGRSFSQVRAQYYETVRPMHLAFVEPSKRFADVIVPEGGTNRVALELISSRLREHLAAGAKA
jgi:uridine kinase